MKVRLIAYTQGVCGEEPLDIVERCASVCYNSTPTPTHKIAKSCAKSGHMSVYEHISFTFLIEGVSRALLAQLTRHRHAAYSVQSQRYCDMSNCEFVIPESFEDIKYTDPYVFEDLDVLRDVYNILVKNCNIPKEDARMILPNATPTKLAFTVNARALVEIAGQRLCNRAQKEIRELFQNIRQEVENVCPEVAALVRPQCEQHDIPFCEEQNCCGMHKKLKDLVKCDIMTEKVVKTH